MAKRKTNVNSPKGQSDALAAAYGDVHPPKHVRLTDADMPFFESVIQEYAKSEWTPHSLELAALLARTMRMYEDEQFLLDKEGSKEYTDKGTPVANPRKTVVQMHAGTILSLRKSLAIDARGKGDKGRDIAKRRATAKKNEAGAVDDDLIARPTAH